MKAAPLITVITILFSAHHIPRAAAQADACFRQLPGVIHLLGGTDIDMVFHDTVSCRQAPRLFVYENVERMSGSLSGVAAFVTHENELLISYPSRIYCPLCVGCKCVKEFSAPLSLTFPEVDVSRISGFAVMKVKKINIASSIDTLAITVAVNSGLTELLIAEIILCNPFPTAAAYTIDTTIRYTLKTTAAGQVIRGLSPFDGSGAVAVFGSKGLLRVVGIGDTVSEINHDADPSEELVCAGGGYAGSSDGTVYRIGEKEPVAEIGAPLRTVSAAGAGGDGGLLAEYAGTVWNRFDAGDMSVRHFQFLRTEQGKEALIVDEAYGLHRVLLCDSATRLAVDSPAALVPALNGPVFRHNGGDLLKARFSLSDPEGNIEPPRIMQHTADTVRPVVILDGVGESCVCGRQNVLNGMSFPVDVTSDSVFFNGNCRGTVCPVQGGELECLWVAGNCSTAVSWSPGDTVVISVGNDYVKILNYAYTPAVRHDQHGFKPAPELRDAADGIVAALRHGTASAKPTDGLTIQIYSCQGKLMNRETLLRPLPPGLYLVRIGSKSGVLSRRVCVVRPGQ
ncbi:MAG: T9SS type A sorting domain-containing protein [Chitinispirillaceae bacterium]|nr:T9SS type A sorting domain-containing protein [Chitinispirillaceae bacterium]